MATAQSVGTVLQVGTKAVTVALPGTAAASSLSAAAGPVGAMIALQGIMNAVNAGKYYKQNENQPRANAAFQPVSAKAGALSSMWSPQQFADLAKKDQGAALEAARKAGVTEFRDGQAYGTNKYSGIPIKLNGLTSDIFGLDKTQSGAVSSSGGVASVVGSATGGTSAGGESATATGGTPSTIPTPPALSSPLVRNAAGKATGYKADIQPLPQVQDFSVQDAGNRERKRRARLRAENTTIATSTRGLVGTANTGAKTLFGQ